MPSLEERLRARVVVDSATGCHNWTGGRNPRGYGRIRVAQRGLLLTHRVAYELLVGPIPGGLVIDHLCRNPACCNPAHLEPVTQRENTRRGNSGLKESTRTHCPQGHPYSPENTYRPPSSNERHCLTCIRARVRSEASRIKDNERHRVRRAEAVIARGGKPRKKRAVAESGGTTPVPASKSDRPQGLVKGERYDEAKALVVTEQKASVSYIQRKLQCGYNEAASYIEAMEEEGIVSAAVQTSEQHYPPWKRSVLVPPPPAENSAHSPSGEDASAGKDSA